jgi:hypothetical protein
VIARITLSEENFRALVSGEVVKDTGANGRLIVEIILSDIDFERMQEILTTARTRKALNDGAAAAVTSRLREKIQESEAGEST